MRPAAQTPAVRQLTEVTAGSLRQSEISALSPMRAACANPCGSMMAASSACSSFAITLEAIGHMKASASALPRGPPSSA